MYATLCDALREHYIMIQCSHQDFALESPRADTAEE